MWILYLGIGVALLATHKKKSAVKMSDNTVPKITRSQFVKQLNTAAKSLSARSGIPSALIITQAAHESNNGNSFLARKAFNLFGIKAGDSWKGETIELPTNENIAGKDITVVAKFRKYPSYDASLADWLNFLSKARYTEALAFAKMGQADQFFSALQRAGYATDPLYSSKLSSVYKSIAPEVA